MSACSAPAQSSSQPATDISDDSEPGEPSGNSTEQKALIAKDVWELVEDLEPSLLPELTTPQLEDPQPGEDIAILHTNHGDIWVRLFPELAPRTVENFVTHAKNGYYDELTFHRIVAGFMIQGGCPLGNGTGGESIWGGTFEDEFTPKLRNITGALSMANSGTNTNGSQFFIVNSPELQPYQIDDFEFFLNNLDTPVTRPDDGQPFLDEMGGYIVYNQLIPADIPKAYLEHGGSPHLDFGHSVFGHVFRGMDVVDSISKVEVSYFGNQDPRNDRPIDPVIIHNIEIRTY
jgi:peptidyl-prolyl cis-trans isomerase B (cyclophilin B)